MPTRPKQQHYVTRAYLEGFLEAGHEFLFCYGRQRRSPFQSRPRELARERSYYSFRQADGAWNDSLEHEIAERVETPGLEIIRKLSSGNTRLDWPQRDALAMLMALQRFRVPHLRQIIDAVHAEVIQRLLSEYDRGHRERGAGRLWIRTIPLVSRHGDEENQGSYVSREELEKIQTSIQQDPGQFSRETLFSSTVSFAKMFRRMKWTIYYSDEDSPFITSDCPVLLRHEREDFGHAGIIRPDTHIEFPLSRTSFLSMTHDFALINRLGRLKGNREARRMLNHVPEIRVSRVGAEQVRQLNLSQAEYCSHWTFCGRQNNSLIEVLRARSRNVRQRISREGGLIRIESLAGRP